MRENPLGDAEIDWELPRATPQACGFSQIPAKLLQPKIQISERMSHDQSGCNAHRSKCVDSLKLQPVSGAALEPVPFGPHTTITGPFF
jgi:hypothetical protein